MSDCSLLKDKEHIADIIQSTWRYIAIFFWLQLFVSVCSGEVVRDADVATGVSRASVSRAASWTLSRKEVLHPPGELNEA